MKQEIDKQQRDYYLAAADVARSRTNWATRADADIERRCARRPRSKNWPARRSAAKPSRKSCRRSSG
ncbi:MAG: hypothetical protein ACLUQ6_09700 [Alistipes onderdonkii]